MSSNKIQKALLQTSLPVGNRVFMVGSIWYFCANVSCTSDRWIQLIDTTNQYRSVFHLLCRSVAGHLGPSNLWLATFLIVNVFPAVVMFSAYFKIGIQLCDQKVELTRDQSFGPILRKQTSSFRLEKIIQCRRVVARRFVILTLVFAVCWVPYNITTLLMDFPLQQGVHEYLMAFLPFGLLRHANSAINPLLCCWLNQKFGRCFIELLQCQKRSAFHRVRAMAFYHANRR
ncbi:substance-K receptor-like [Tachypleus tridentatus]|uniref:substance-K receptor-like n=1 Tax=Tachypleus tridentatus TaxID=6853 RepID=UPI003FD509D9